MSYAGDVTCKECWHTLSEDSKAQLVDVRTMPEWVFVGVPELNSLGRNAILVEWQQYPSMQVNPTFVENVTAKLEESGADETTPVFTFCRVGVRSIPAAQALTAAGYESAYNVLEGFEGSLDGFNHRGNIAGWKHDGLPWQQG